MVYEVGTVHERYALLFSPRFRFVNGEGCITVGLQHFGADDHRNDARSPRQADREFGVSLPSSQATLRLPANRDVPRCSEFSAKSPQPLGFVQPARQDLRG